jgi:hypothetical protein
LTAEAYATFNELELFLKKLLSVFWNFSSENLDSGVTNSTERDDYVLDYGPISDESRKNRKRTNALALSANWARCN